VRTWLEGLPEVVREAGISLSEHGANEMCFRRMDALRVIDAMRRSELPCLGGDEWLVGDGVFRPSYESWYVLRGVGESMEHLAKRSWEDAGRFVRERLRPESCVVFVVGPYQDPKKTTTFTPQSGQ